MRPESGENKPDFVCRFKAVGTEQGSKSFAVLKALFGSQRLYLLVVFAGFEGFCKPLGVDCANGRTMAEKKGQ